MISLITRASALAVVCAAASFAHAQMLVTDPTGEIPLDEDVTLPEPQGLPMPPPPRVAETAALAFETTQIDLGRIPDGTVARLEYPFTNRSQNPIRIHHVDTGCGCSALLENLDVIEPGETRSLKIDFQSAGRIGENRRFVRINTDDPNFPVYTVMFAATVVREVFAEPSIITFGNFQAGEPQTASFAVMNQTGRPIGVRDIRSENPHITARVARDAELIEWEGEEVLRTMVLVELGDGFPQGAVNARLLVSMDDDQTPSFLVNLRGMALGNVNISPDRAMFTAVRGVDIERSFRITSRSAGPLSISDVRPVTHGDVLDSSVREGAHAGQKIVTVRLTNPEESFTTILNITALEEQSGRRTNLQLPVHVIVRNPAAETAAPAATRPGAVRLPSGPVMVPREQESVQ